MYSKERLKENNTLSLIIGGYIVILNVEKKEKNEKCNGIIVNLFLFLFRKETRKN